MKFLSSKNIFLFITISLISIINLSCKKEQSIADFSASTTYGTTPLLVSFNNKSLYATSYEWDFGDGTTSSDENPSHTFYNSGTYIVTLKASNDNNSDKKSLTINVTPKAKPVADFSFTPSTGMAPCEIYFTNATTGASSYSWDFGNGQTSSLQNPSLIYVEGGTYTITLTATGSGGTDKITKTITIKNAPTKLKVNSITLTGYPLTKADGSGWDLSSGPDLYFKLTDNDKTNHFTSGIYNDVVKSNLPLKYTNGFPLTFSELDFEYIIRLMDDETPFADELGAYYFKIRNWMPTDGSDYPTTLFFDSNTSELEFYLDVEWLP